MHNEAEELRRELEWLYAEYNKVLEANSGLEKEVAQLTQDNYELNRLIDEIDNNGGMGK
jgi:predicted nuclease with TOPRIM domain